jgi:hypothetical protein
MVFVRLSIMFTYAKELSLYETGKNCEKSYPCGGWPEKHSNCAPSYERPTRP